MLESCGLLLPMLLLLFASKDERYFNNPFLFQTLALAKYLEGPLSELDHAVA